MSVCSLVVICVRISNRASGKLSNLQSINSLPQTGSGKRNPTPKRICVELLPRKVLRAAGVPRPMGGSVEPSCGPLERHKSDTIDRAGGAVVVRCPPRRSAIFPGYHQGFRVLCDTDTTPAASCLPLPASSLLLGPRLDPLCLRNHPSIHPPAHPIPPASTTPRTSQTCKWTLSRPSARIARIAAGNYGTEQDGPRLDRLQLLFGQVEARPQARAAPWLTRAKALGSLFEPTNSSLTTHTRPIFPPSRHIPGSL